MVNRSLTDSVTTDIVWQDGKTVQVDQAWQLAGTLDITNKKVNE